MTKAKKQLAVPASVYAAEIAAAQMIRDMARAAGDNVVGNAPLHEIVQALYGCKKRESLNQ